MKNCKTNYRVMIIVDHYGQASHQLFFATKGAAAKAKKLVLAAKMKYDEDRPNDPEKRFFTVAHDLGELTIKISDILAVHMFHTEEARIADKAVNDEAAKRQAEILAVAVREAVAAGNKK